MASGTAEPIEVLGTMHSDSKTFPFTAPSDGVLYYRFNAQSSSAVAYVYLRRTSPDVFFIAQHQSAGGVAITGNLIVKKGWTIEVNYISNAALERAQFLPFA